jgi:hypothetical protein
LGTLLRDAGLTWLLNLPTWGSVWSGGDLSSMVCMVSQTFAARVNRSYLEFWTVTGGPQYPRYFTPIIDKAKTNELQKMDF